MHIISILIVLALLGVSVSIIGMMLMTYRHAIMSALKAEPAAIVAFQPVGRIARVSVTEANVACLSAVELSRSAREECLALAA